jgi:hypothetical protein
VITESNPTNPNLTCTESCPPGACQLRCSLEVVDELLSTPGAVSGEDSDVLLDLRYVLRARQDAERALRLFCELRLRLERRHYLAVYRLRRWLENHIVAEVRSCPATVPARIRLRLNTYCVEAVRRSCLCAATNEGFVLLAPRLKFSFVPELNAVSREKMAVTAFGTSGDL